MMTEGFTDDDKVILEKAYTDKVFWAENFLYNEAGKTYKLEQHQKDFLYDESPYKIGFWGRRMGKTTITVIDILHKVCFEDNYKVMIVTPKKRQAMNISETISDLIMRSKFLQALIKKDHVFKKRFKNGSKIDLDTVGKDSVTSLIGSGTNYMYMDESQEIPDDLYGKILPILRGQTLQKPIMVQTGTPDRRDGFFYRNMEKAYSICENGVYSDGHPEGLYSLHRRPSAFIDDDGNIIGSGTKRLTIKELEDDKSTMNSVQFRQEYCLEFLDELGEVYSESLLDQCELDYAPSIFGSKKLCVGGLDFGKKINPSVLMIAEINNGKKEIKWIKKWEHTDYETIANFLIYTLPKKFPNLAKICADATGTGDAIIEKFDKKVKYEIEPFTFTNKSKIDLVEYVVSEMETDNIKIIPNDQFRKEATEYCRGVTKSGRQIYEKGESDDFVDSFNLCVYGARKVKPLIKPSSMILGGNIMANRGMNHGIIGKGLSIFKKGNTNQNLKEHGLL